MRINKWTFCAAIAKRIFRKTTRTTSTIGTTIRTFRLSFSRGAVSWLPSRTRSITFYTKLFIYAYHSWIESESREILQETTASPSHRTNSPSLSDLENMKKRLLVEFQKSSPQLNTDVLSRNNDLDSSTKSDMPPPSNEVTPESNRIRRNTLNSSRGSVKSIDLGTPVLQSTSPYNKLPSSEKFSKNICDVIDQFRESARFDR